MSVGYNLGCLDCLKEVDAVSSSLAGNSPGELQEMLDFIVEHHGHRLVCFCDDEMLNKETGRVEIVY